LQLKGIARAGDRAALLFLSQNEIRKQHP